jgi:type III restriction enzyme
VVPSDAIYRQTWKQLADREHPYWQILERASGGRVKLLEKGDGFSRREVEGQLCVMLLMLPSAVRKSKETLRLFRDSGRFTSFFPPEDDSDANRKLLDMVGNLDINDLSDQGWMQGIVPGALSVAADSVSVEADEKLKRTIARIELGAGKDPENRGVRG